MVDLIEVVGVHAIDGERLGWVDASFADLRVLRGPAFPGPDGVAPLSFGVECIDAGLEPGPYLVCGHAEVDDAPFTQIVAVSSDGERRVVAGPAWGPWEGASGPMIIGHWRYADEGPDGVLLAQWSGECEVPTAHLLRGGEVWSLAIEGDGMRLAPKAEAESDDVIVPSSGALGWLPDGRAAVAVTSSACSWPAPDGVYTVDPETDAVELLFETEFPILYRA